MSRSLGGFSGKLDLQFSECSGKQGRELNVKIGKGSDYKQ